MELFPEHGEPLLAGTGLVQVRMRVCDPPPHVTSQALHVPQVDQPPSTKQSRNCNKKIINIKNSKQTVEINIKG